MLVVPKKYAILVLMWLNSLSVFLKRKMEEYEALKVEIAMLTSEIEAENGKKPSEK